MDETKARMTEEIQALKEENRRLREALEWAAHEMQVGGSRWSESCEPGERYYDWFVRVLRDRAGLAAPAEE